jgi:hypothetical protein
VRFRAATITWRPLRLVRQQVLNLTGERRMHNRVKGSFCRLRLIRSAQNYVFKCSYTGYKSGMKWFTFRALVGCFLCFGASSFAQSSPVNDNFENRIILSGRSVTFPGTLANATIEAGEPLGVWNSGAFAPWTYFALYVDASVWWSWTAPATGPTTLEIFNSSTNAIKASGMDVWTGTNLATDFAIVEGVNLSIGRHPFLHFLPSLALPTIYA